MDLSRRDPKASLGWEGIFNSHESHAMAQDTGLIHRKLVNSARVQFLYVVSKNWV